MDQDETWHAGRPRPRPHCVRRGPSCPSPKGGRSPQFSAHICCWQMAGWIKMPLSMEEGLSLGDFVLDGDPAQPSLKRGRSPPPPLSPVFGPCPLWPNGWMDQDDTWHKGGPWCRLHCARLRPSSLHKKGAEPPPQFLAHFIVAKRLEASRCHSVYGGRPQPRRVCVRWGPSPPPLPKKGAEPSPQF